MRKRDTVVDEIELHFPQFENEDQMTESEICIACHGCCSYVTVPLEYPRSRQKRDLYTWYLHHRNVEIFIDHDRVWNLLFKTPCDQMSTDGACNVYETRPDICREYSAKACSRVGSDHTDLFRTPEDMFEYLENRKRSRSANKRDTKSTGESESSEKPASSSKKNRSATARRNRGQWDDTWEEQG